MVEYSFGYMDENTACPRGTALPNPGKAVSVYLHKVSLAKNPQKNSRKKSQNPNLFPNRVSIQVKAFSEVQASEQT